MWIRMLDSGQEIDMVEHKAKFFIAGGHAVEIKPPTPRKDDTPPAPVYVPPTSIFEVSEYTSDEDINAQAKTFAYKTGVAPLANFVAHTMKLERRLLQLENRLCAADAYTLKLERRIAQLESNAEKLLATTQV